MGRNVVEATNAWRMRRMRGETGRLRLFAAAVREEAVVFVDVFAAGFFAPVFAVAGLFGGFWVGADWSALPCPAGCATDAGDACAGTVSWEGVADFDAVEAAKPVIVIARSAPHTSAGMRKESKRDPGNNRFFRRDARARRLSKPHCLTESPGILTLARL